MPKEQLTPRERWVAVLTRQKPDRVPMDYWGTPEATARLIRHLGLSHSSEQLLAKDLTLPAVEANMLRAEGPRARRELLKQLHVDFVVGVAPARGRKRADPSRLAIRRIAQRGFTSPG